MYYLCVGSLFDAPKVFKYNKLEANALKVMDLVMHKSVESQVTSNFPTKVSTPFNKTVDHRYVQSGSQLV
jgi:hypothetical protein